MSERIWMGIVVALSVAVWGARAEATTPPQFRNITVTGYVKRSQPSRDTSTTKFLLTHPARKTARAVGTSGEYEVVPEYRLRRHNAELEKFIDHEVEISGLAPMSAPEPDASSPLESAPKLIVTKIRPIASTCR
jgi:hypothetical protein